MSIDQNYVKFAEETTQKFKDKISKMNTSLKAYESKNKKQLLSKSKELKEKYKELEENLKKLKTSTEKNFEEIKETSTELLNELTDEFDEYSNLFTIDKIMQAEEQIAEFGMEKKSQFEELVKKNPLASAAIALGVGVALGAFFKRSK